MNLLERFAMHMAERLMAQDGWITIKGKKGEDGDGRSTGKGNVHVFIGEGGKIEKGPGSMKGKTIKQLKAENAAKTKANAEAAGLTVEEYKKAQKEKGIQALKDHNAKKKAEKDGVQTPAPEDTQTPQVQEVPETSQEQQVPAAKTPPVEQNEPPVAETPKATAQDPETSAQQEPKQGSVLSTPQDVSDFVDNHPAAKDWNDATKQQVKEHITKYDNKFLDEFADILKDSPLSWVDDTIDQQVEVYKKAAEIKSQDFQDPESQTEKPAVLSTPQDVGDFVDKYTADKDWDDGTKQEIKENIVKYDKKNLYELADVLEASPLSLVDDTIGEQVELYKKAAEIKSPDFQAPEPQAEPHDVLSSKEDAAEFIKSQPASQYLGESSSSIFADEIAGKDAGELVTYSEKYHKLYQNTGDAMYKSIEDMLVTAAKMKGGEDVLATKQKYDLSTPDGVSDFVDNHPLAENFTEHWLKNVKDIINVGTAEKILETAKGYKESAENSLGSKKDFYTKVANVLNEAAEMKGSTGMKEDSAGSGQAAKYDFSSHQGISDFVDNHPLAGEWGQIVKDTIKEDIQESDYETLSKTAEALEHQAEMTDNPYYKKKAAIYKEAAELKDIAEMNAFKASAASGSNHKYPKFEQSAGYKNFKKIKAEVEKSGEYTATEDGISPQGNKNRKKMTKEDLKASASDANKAVLAKTSGLPQKTLADAMDTCCAVTVGGDSHNISDKGVGEEAYSMFELSQDVKTMHKYDVHVKSVVGIPEDATVQELASAYDYVRGSGHINRPLCGYSKLGKVSTFDNQQIEPDQQHGGKSAAHLTNLISRNQTKEDLVLYRGVKEGMLQKMLDSCKNNGSFLNNAFTSCTSRIGQASGFGLGNVVCIEIPKGTHAISLQGIGYSGYNDEKETLLQRNTRFEHVGKKWVKGELLDVFRVVPE